MAEPSDKFRVTMVNKYYSPPHLGGIEMVVRTLSEGLVQHAGVDVQALVSNEDRRGIMETIAGVRVVRLPRYASLSSSPIAVGMKRALREGPRMALRQGSEVINVLNLHSPYPWGELCFLRARPDMPSVVLYHSDIVRQKRMLAVYRPFLERFLDRVDLIVASSPNLVQGSEFLAPRASKCRVVPFGLPEERLVPSLEVSREAADLRASHQGRKIVLFVGRLVYYKGVDVLVRAMTQVDADLVIIGEGPLEPRLRALALEIGVAGRLSFLSPQTDHVLMAWYHAADVLCLPSVARSEAFGLVQIEAHAAGVPVVSTNLPTGVPYANLDGVTGIIVPPADSAALGEGLNRLLTDDELRVRLGRQAQERALRDFTVPRMVSDMLRVYSEAVKIHAEDRRTA